MTHGRAWAAEYGFAPEDPLKRALGSLRRAAAVTAVALLSSLAARADAGPPPSLVEISGWSPAPGERALGARLLAPCCWQGTLDVHESDPAQALRMQIRSRLYAGETVETIEASLVEQYGERIRARPQRDPLGVVAMAMMLVAAFAGLAVVRIMRRWRQAGPSSRGAPRAAMPAQGDEYDARLDAELADMN